MISVIVCRVSVNMETSFSLYCGSGGRPATSVKHLRVTLRNSGTSRNLLRSVSSMLAPVGGVAKMYPRGIQLRKRKSVSKVAFIRLGWLAVLRISEHKLYMAVNSSHMLCFSCLVLAEVIWSAEKSKTSSDSKRRIAMLFSQIGRLL